MQQVIISVCAWCGMYLGYAVYDAPDDVEPVAVSHGICTECAKRQYMELGSLGVVQLASPAEIESGKAAELARFAPEGGE